MPRYKVCTSNDTTAAIALPPFLMTVHAYVGPAMVPLAPCVEPPAPMFWPPGALLGQNKLTKKTMHRGMPLVQDGHDIGACIPHASIPPVNGMTPLQWTFSKRAVMFFETSVRFERRFAGAASAYAWPPAPMMTCMDPLSMPVGTAVSERSNTVSFGMTWGSYLASAAIVAATMVLDAVLKGPKGLNPPFIKGLPPFKGPLFKDLGKDIAKKLAGGSKPKEILAKVGLSAAVGLGKFLSTDGTRKVSISIPGSPFIRGDLAQGPNGEIIIGGKLNGQGREVDFDGMRPTDSRGTSAMDPAQVWDRSNISRWGAR